MCANSRHRAERRSNELTRTPQALIARVPPPTFDLVSLRGLEASRTPRHARKVDTSYAKYVGRIGALAVSLGVGVAVATTPGVAWAAPDSDSDAGASAAPGPKTSPDAKPDSSTSSKPDTSNPDTSTSSQTTATETPAEGSSSKGETNPTNDRVPAMKVDSSGGAITSTLRTAGETASSATDASAEKDVAATPETSTSAATTAPEEAAPTTPVVPVEPVTPVEPVGEVPVPVVPVVEVPVEPAVSPTDPHSDSPKPNDGQTAGSDAKPRMVVDHVQSGPTDKGGSDASATAADDTARHMSALTSGGQTEDSSNNALMSALAAPQVQAPAPFDPVGALLAIPGQLFDVASGFVALVITPFLAPTPDAPAQMPLLWTVLAWVRREISHTFFNRSPIANPVQISQTVTGEVTGNLNATDPNGDEPLTYTVTQQPAHGTVVVRPDGTYTYTPTAGAPTSTLTDSFTVSIDDSVGTRLPGIFGVVQGILHSLAQAIGIAQPDTTVKQVAVTVAGTGVNLPPLVVTSVINPIPYTAGSAPRVLDSNLTVVDGSSDLSGGTVSIGLGFTPGDTLTYTQPANNPITGSYNSATGVLTLTGTATVAQYQDALRAVAFSTTSNALVGVRTVSFVVTDDGGLSSISVPLTVTVLALNLPPVVTTSVVGPIVTAGNPPVTLDDNVTIIDGSGSMTGAQVSIGLGFSQGDTLGYTAPQDNPITGSYNAMTGVLTLSGTGTVAQYQEALRAVTFSTTAGAVVGARTVSFVVTDEGALSSISVPLAVTVLALNLPPVVTTSVVGPIVTAGSGQVTLDGNVTIVDGSPTITGATVSITLGHDSTDTLGYTAPLNNPIAGSYDAATGVLTLSGTGTVAQYQEALRAITFSTGSSTLASVRTVSFVVTDDGGLSSISVPLAVTVLAINLPPVVVTSILNTIPFTAGNTPVALDPNVTVIDGSASLSGATVAITVGLTDGDSLAFTQPPGSSIIGSYNSTTGVLMLTGTGTVAQYQEALRSVTFATTTATLVGVRTVSFVVTDIEGLPSVSVPLAVTVALNLPPIVTSSVVGLSLNVLNAAPPKILDPGVTIIDDSSRLTGATVSIGGLIIGGNDTLSFTSPPGSGITGEWNADTKTLTLSGAASVEDYQTALRSVTFATSGILNLGARIVSFVVMDQQGQSSISVPLTVVVVSIL